MVWQTLFAQRDCILLAKTSFGKSVILQAPSVIIPYTLSLVILPLDKIGEEQCEKISRLPGTKPCLVKQETATPKLFQEIKEGKYTHILMGPEQALGKEMRKAIRSPCFQKRLVMVAIDEVHLVSQWGDGFRKDYAKLVALRGLIPRKVPFIACSVTLDQMTLKDVIQKAGFKKDVDIFRTSVDWPEITYIIQHLEPKTVSTFAGLHFTLDKGVNVRMLSESCVYCMIK
jgi:superfamily II DNA helicase RecQ